MRDLTARQQQILSLIQQHIADTGFPPTRAEIATQLGFRSPNAAEEHLKASTDGMDRELAQSRLNRAQHEYANAVKARETTLQFYQQCVQLHRLFLRRLDQKLQTLSGLLFSIHIQV